VSTGRSDAVELDENEASCVGAMELPLSPTNGSRALPAGGPQAAPIAFRPMMALQLVVWRVRARLLSHCRL
jgi:hypothetical protein